MKKIIFSILALSLIAGCFSCQEKIDIEKEKAANLVKNRNLEMWSIWEQNDPNKVLPYFVDDADLSWVNEPAIFLNNLLFINNLEDVGNWYKSAASERSSTQVKIKNEYFNVISSDCVLHVYDCDWTVNDFGASGNTAQGAATASVVWVFKNREWYILHFHMSWEQINL